jgi:LmbE family N-acetylglucosaminyl deacetylase
MRTVFASLVASIALLPSVAGQQSPARTLVAVYAHPDDESSASPLLAKYAREGVKVHLIVATDGAAGGQNTSIPRGPELARARAEEARCATDALGAAPPILLDFPDGQLGNYAEDPLRLFKLTQRVHEELQRLRPDALITWGPDGGTGHPDHRLVSAVVTQLVRTGAPGVPERLFYASLPEAAMKVASPRGVPPMLIPDAKHLTTRVPFTQPDLESAKRSLSCHKTQFPPEVIAKVAESAKAVWNGVVPVSPAFASAGKDDLFR